MPRPKKCRRVGFIPKCLRFIPDGIEVMKEQEVVITIEEIEAIRLSDLEGLEQNQCSEKMGISRGTFQRIINSSRQKVSDAIVNGKSIRIEGGNYKRNVCNFVCKSCGHRWDNSDDTFKGHAGIRCSLCDCEEYDCSSEDDCCGKCCCKHHEKQ